MVHENLVCSLQIKATDKQNLLSIIYSLNLHANEAQKVKKQVDLSLWTNECCDQCSNMIQATYKTPALK